MKKYFLITALFFLIGYDVICQNFGSDPRDSIRYNEMEKRLSTAEGKAKVDLLNSISEMTESIATGWDTTLMRRKYDTIRHYGKIAYELASKIRYSDGMAMALVNLNWHGSPETIYQVPLKDRDEREENISKAITLAEKTNNYEILGKAYDALGTLNIPFRRDSQSVARSKKSEYYFQLAKDTEALANSYTWATEDYEAMADFEKAFEYGEKNLEFLKNTNIKFFNWHHFLVQESLESMSTLYTKIGDYQNALTCLKESDNYGDIHKTGWRTNALIANLYCEMSQYDSALHYWNLWRYTPDWINYANGHRAWGYAVRAKIYLANKQYDSALAIHRMDIDWYKAFNNSYGIGREWTYISNVYDAKGMYDSALFYVRNGLAAMQSLNIRPEMMDNYKLLSSVYHHLHNDDSAYKYLQIFIAIKDSIDNKQLLLRLFKQRLDASNQLSKSSLQLLTKENALKTEQLNKESTEKKFLLILLLAFLLTCIFIYRNIHLKRKNEKLQLENRLEVQKLENEKKQAELKRQASDLQMQALRAQMNPHFIFNSLSSINWFIMENDKETASDYLTRFSRLMRMVLNAQKSMIPLEDELKMLQLYLDMERMRFENSFDYCIAFTNAIDAGIISIPPMLLQPFCENAIWHGFMNKVGQGHLIINIRTEEDMLECTISDNGVGRKQAALFKNRFPKKERSLGLEITRERLSLFSEENNAEANFIIEDLEDENGMSKGTKVILRIGYKNYIEKVA